MSLRLSAIMFGVLWTLFMMWWSAPLDTAALIVWPIAGFATAVAWYAMMSRWTRARAR